MSNQIHAIFMLKKAMKLYLYMVKILSCKLVGPCGRNVGFEEKGKLEYLKKKSRSRVQSQNSVHI